MASQTLCDAVNYQPDLCNLMCGFKTISSSLRCLSISCLEQRALSWFFQQSQISLQQQLQRVSCWCSCWPGTSVLVVNPCLKASSLQRVTNFTCKWWHQTKQSPAIYWRGWVWWPISVCLCVCVWGGLIAPHQVDGHSAWWAISHRHTVFFLLLKTRLKTALLEYTIL